MLFISNFEVLLVRQPKCLNLNAFNRSSTLLCEIFLIYSNLLPKSHVDLHSSSRQTHPNIIVKFVPSINISHGVDEARRNFELFSNLRKKYPDIIRGIDLSGDPTKGKFADYKEIFEKARDEGFRLALHCAEVKNDEEILDMLEFLTSDDRIGHGTFISEGKIESIKSS